MKNLKHDLSLSSSVEKLSPVADPAGMDGKVAYTMMLDQITRDDFLSANRAGHPG